MKTIFTLFFTLLALVSGGTPRNSLQVRGGCSIGPLDGNLAVKLSKAGATAFVAGSAAKYINGQTGGRDTQLVNFVTGDLWQLNAVIAGVSAAMFHLADTGFDTLKMMAVANALALLLRLDSAGLSIDTIRANKVQTVMTIVLAVIAFVE